ncbi:MAG: formylglycine-generating enzyme family protein [Sedimenticola sp.]
MSGISRADLLRVLCEQPDHRRGHLALALGYERLETCSRSASVDVDSLAVISFDTTSPPKATWDLVYQAKRDPRYWYVTRCWPQRLMNQTAPGDWGEFPSEDPMGPRLQMEQHLSLLTTGQWQNLWDRALPELRRSRRIDLPRSLKYLTQARPLIRLPRQHRQSFNRRITLLLEHTPALYAAWPDMREAWQSLRMLVGKRALDTLFLPAGPAGPWYRDRESRAAESVTLESINPKSLLLVISDFGCLQTGKTSGQWARVLDRLSRHAGSLLLLPLCPLRQTRYPMLPLDPAHSGVGHAERGAVERLLAMLSKVFRATRVQVRMLRKVIDGANLHTELLAYDHEETKYEDGRLQLTEERLPHYLERFSNLPESLREAAARRQQVWLPTLNTLEQEIESLQGELLTGVVPKTGRFPTLFYQAHQSNGELEQASPGRAFRHIRTVLPLLRHMADRYASAHWQPVYESAQRVALRSNQPLPLRQQGLVQSADTHWLAQSSEGLTFGTGAVQESRLLLKLSAQPFHLQSRNILPHLIRPTGSRLDLIDNGYHFSLEAMRRPLWAGRIWQDEGGLNAAHATGTLFRLEPAGPDLPQARWQCTNNPWPWADDLGVDEHGLWAEIRLAQATQRLRWIPPGKFMMGSPKDEEKGTFYDETLHKVTLSRGYWLGETSCTRAFWHAVMGGETEGDPALPVNRISWDSTRDFFEQLKEHLPGLAWGLPSEAQWEYACRAGTETAYWWGDEMDEKRANKSSKHKLEAAMSPNAFGLRSMSGNLNEWCADWMGNYPAGPVVDPTGPDQGHERVLRGGGWFGYGSFLRSAYRSGRRPGERFGYVGLRLAGGSDPQASQGASGMSADRREWSDRERGAQAAGGGAGEGRR